MNDLTHRRVAIETRSTHNRVVAMVLAIFFGYWGVHRLYTGRYVSALIWFFTGGLFGFGWIFDVFMLLIGRFKDSEGRVLGPPQHVPAIADGNAGGALTGPTPMQRRAKTEDDVALEEAERDPLEDKFAELEREMKAAR